MRRHDEMRKKRLRGRRRLDPCKLLRDAVRAKTIERFELRIARFLRAMV
jgi:hypothetical protein